MILNCDVYVLNSLQYEIILRNNCLNELNFEISDNGLKVTGKGNNGENFMANL